MKNFKRLFGIATLVAIIATTAAPQAQAKKKNDPKKQEIEEKLSLGNDCYLKQEFEQAVMYYEQAHKLGDVRATNNLAMCYAGGEGVAQNYDMAFKLYEKAAKKNYADAQVSLGTLYMNGQGCKKDYKKAIKWLEKAAKQKNDVEAASDAMYLIGLCYYYGGNGIKRDTQKAKQWISKSAALGNETAIENLPKLK